MGQNMGEIDDYLKTNSGHAAGYSEEVLSSSPTKRVAIVACMDARLEFGLMLGLKRGDAHVIRNAGGVVTDDVIRSLTISQRKLGTREIMLVHHTDCGMMTFTSGELKDEIQKETGIRPAFAMEAFVDIEESVRQSMARIRVSPFVVHKNEIRGFVYEVETGRLREVE